MTRSLNNGRYPAQNNAEVMTAASAAGSESSETAVTSPATCGSSIPYTRTPWDNELDAAENVERPLPGWPEVSKLIANTPDFEAFQPFRDLNIKSLLYYQAELILLRKKLHQAEYDDSRRRDNDKVKHAPEFARDLERLIESGESDDPELKIQWELIKEIRGVLKEYNAALLQYSQISALPQADSFNVESLRVWLKRVGDYSISGPGSLTWGDMYDKEAKPKPLKWQLFFLILHLFWTPKGEKAKLDLIVPCQGRKVDGLTRWVAKEWVPFYQGLCDAMRSRRMRSSDAESGSAGRGDGQSRNGKGRPPSSRSSASEIPTEESAKEQNTLNKYSEDRILRFTSAVATVIACLLPTVAIAVLAKLHSTANVLGGIASFTAVFAIGLMFLTDAGTTRVEIFTATAAFSAVMVVFVQNQNSLSPTPA